MLLKSHEPAPLSALLSGNEPAPLFSLLFNRHDLPPCVPLMLSNHEAAPLSPLLLSNHEPAPFCCSATTSQQHCLHCCSASTNQHHCLHCCSATTSQNHCLHCVYSILFAGVKFPRIVPREARGVFPYETVAAKPEHQQQQTPPRDPQMPLGGQSPPHSDISLYTSLVFLFKRPLNSLKSL